MKLMYANNIRECQLVAEKIFNHIKMHRKVVLYLTGAMGAGKTTFCNFLVSFFNGTCVSSSSFGIVNTIFADRFILHCDFYRYQPDDYFVECEIMPLLQKDYLLIIEWGNLEKLFTDSVNYSVSIEVRNDLSRCISFMEI
jgi:tRNA threonylcarbamoyl adenosine modification protein YjeE